MVTPHQSALTFIIGFGSLVIIPFLGILNLFKKFRVFPYLATFVFFWFAFGEIAVLSGVTPLGPGDIVTPEQRRFWFSQPGVQFLKHLWLAGLILAVPLLVVTWLYERTQHVSTVLKVIKKITTVAAFIGGIFSFIKFVIIPNFFR